MARRVAFWAFVALVFLPTAAFGQTGFWPADFVDRQTIHAAHLTKKEALYRCYQANTTAASREHGDVVKLLIVTSAAGRVFRVDFLESSYTNPKMEQCLRAIFDGLDYGRPAAQKTTFVQKFGFQEGIDKLTISLPEAAGGPITSDSVKQIAAARAAEVKACYDKALKEVPTLRGQMLVELVIDGRTGRTNSVRVQKATLSNGTLQSCIVDLVRTFTFPPANDPGIVIVTYPFTFDSN